ncbi:MAG: hypothetical protein ACM3ML_13070 [Micromonosporaceae bacterium]
MNAIAVRKIRAGDGTSCARAWADAGRYYASVAPEVIHEPEAEGLADWFERAIIRERDEDTL